MKTIDILEQIVKNNGSCDWVAKHPLKKICSTCILGKQQKAKNGINFLSCFESIIGNGKSHTKEEVDKIYLKKAQDILLNLCAEELLVEKSTKSIFTNVDISKERDNTVSLFMVTVFKSFFNK